MRILILFLLVAGACSRSETSEPAETIPKPSAEEAAKDTAEQPSEAPAGDEAPQAAEKSEPTVDTDAPPTVELLDPGKTPHEALRTTFEVGDKQSLEVKSDWTVSTVYGPMIAVDSVMPSLVYALETEVKESTAERSRFALQVKKVSVKAGKDVKPAKVEAVKKSAASLEGAQGSFSINARGIVEELTIDAPSDESLIVRDMVNQIEQALRLASLPLPEEPVGNGATWTASQTIDQRTAKVRQTSTFELVDVKGKRVRAKITHKGAAPEQSIKMPGSRSGASFTLNGVDDTGEGKGAWRLDHLGPASASEETLVILKMTASAPKREAVLLGVQTDIGVKAGR